MTLSHSCALIWHCAVQEYCSSIATVIVSLATFLLAHYDDLLTAMAKRITNNPTLV